MGTKKGRHRVFFGGSCPKLPSPLDPPLPNAPSSLNNFIPTLQDATGAWAQLRFVVETMQMERTAAMQSTMQGTKLVKDHSNIVAITYRLLLTFVSANVM